MTVLARWSMGPSLIRYGGSAFLSAGSAKREGNASIDITLMRATVSLSRYSGGRIDSSP
jgi:hypothetical protein